MVDDDYAKEFIQEFSLMGFLKISSKTGENVHDAFNILTRKILERQSY